MMKRSSNNEFKDALDDAFSSLGEKGGQVDIMMNAAKLKGSMGEEKQDVSDLNKLAKKHLKKNDKKDDGLSKMIKQLQKQLEKGTKVEMEHTKSLKKAKKIATDHLKEDPKYYDKLEKIETKEVTGSGSSGSFVGPFAMSQEFMKKSNSETPKKVEANEVTGASSAGQYSQPAIWAKSTKKKDWRGAAKPLYKGGKFVQVKGKCKKFPYCNQGDIKSLKLWENEILKKTITKVSKETGLNENTIKAIIQYEFSNIKSKKK